MVRQPSVCLSVRLPNGSQQHPSPEPPLLARTYGPGPIILFFFLRFRLFAFFFFPLSGPKISSLTLRASLRTHLLSMDRHRDKNKNKKRGRPTPGSFDKEASAAPSQSVKPAQPGYEVIPGTDHVNAATDVRLTCLIMTSWRMYRSKTPRNRGIGSIFEGNPFSAFPAAFLAICTYP